MVLSSTVHKVTKVVGKTTAEMFANLKVGDTVQLSIKMEASGRTRRGLYASYITAKHLETGITTEKSFNQMPQFLKKFEWEEVA